jgi:hypothetical protein
MERHPGLGGLDDLRLQLRYLLDRVFPLLLLVLVDLLHQVLNNARFLTDLAPQVDDFGILGLVHLVQLLQLLLKLG